MLKLSSLRNRLALARQRFLNDSLFRNATYLMASTAVMSVLGFVFWVFVAHLYSPVDIGVASALIGIATLIANFSLLGLTSGLIRFLASSKKPSGDINAAAITVALMTILASAAYAFIGTRLGGNAALLQGIWHKLAFIILMCTVSLNSLTDAVFIANRRGEYHTIGYATFGVFKLLLPLVLISYGAMGIFGAYILAMLASLLVSYYLMRRGCHYRLFTKPDWSLLKSIRKYTTHNYVGVVLATIPAQLMPQLIIKELGPADVAFFSMAWTMVNLLYIVPSAVTQSMLAESSFDLTKKSEHLKRTIRLLIMMLVPSVILAIIISPYLLAIFGEQYRQNGTLLFQILSCATFFVAIISVGNTMLNIERRTSGVVVVQFTTMAATGIAALLLMRLGLAGVGMAFLLGDMAGCMVLAAVGLRIKTGRTHAAGPVERDIQTILSDMYGITDCSLEPVTNGSTNHTFLVSAHKRKYILRVYSPGTCRDYEIEQEVSFMGYLARRHIPTPDVVVTSEGTKVGSLLIGGIRWQFILMHYIEGDHPIGYSLHLLQNMARQQAKLHLYGIEYARRSDALQRHETLTLRLRQGLLHALTPAGFSHFDYDASNLLVDEGRIVCVLDFEGMRYGPLVTCIYFTLAQIYEQEGDPALLIHYIDTYERTRRLTYWEKAVLGISLALKYKSPALLQLRTTRHSHSPYWAEGESQ